MGPTRRLKIIKKHKELIGLLRFGLSKGILRHDVIKNLRNYNVYCDVGHIITQKLNKTTGFITFLRCGPPGDPRSPQGPPRSPLGAPKSPLGAPKAALGTPNASPRAPKSSPRHSSRDKHYINKLPINRTAAVMLYQYRHMYKYV